MCSHEKIQHHRDKGVFKYYISKFSLILDIISSASLLIIFILRVPILESAFVLIINEHSDKPALGGGISNKSANLQL